MLYDKEIVISCAGNRKALSWPAQRLMWSEFCRKLATPARGVESYAAYIRMSKAEQDERKDVGGFVGGELRDGKRRNSHIKSRDLITLDLDAIPAGRTDAVRQTVAALGCASAVYSTRKHEPGKPRLRVIVPTDRSVTAEEYEPIARWLGAQLGMENCDPTTFQAVRMMYWPSVCADGEYVYDTTDAAFLSADTVLASYADWRDVRSWPQVPGAAQTERKTAEQQEDPAVKTGIVGAFCRKYDVIKAMDELLPGSYVQEEGDAERYTDTAGSTTGGAIVYGDGKWLYSHHGTDPCSGKLVNAFDMVRLHKFGGMDADAAPGTPTNRLPSYTAMRDLALADEDVRIELSAERIKAAAEAFNTPIEGDDTWLKELTLDGTGLPQKTVNNVLLIMRGDYRLQGRIAYDAFSSRPMARGMLPWDEALGTREWTDNDDAGLRWYLEHVYGLAAKDRVNDALSMIQRENQYDEVREYLEAVEWDGVPRVDTLLSRYLLAEDTPYTRAVMRKTLVAAVARAMEPGCKYDTVLTLIGGQGIGKSTFVRLLGAPWYSDSVQTFEGKEAAEQLRGAWLIEIPEVDRFSNREESICKQFITRQNDFYREAYGHRTVDHPRRCVFIATTNADEFLTDRANRRWWIVRCAATPDRLGADFSQLRADRDQIWAEAVALWRTEEPLTLPPALELEARNAQEETRIEDPWAAEIRAFLDKPIPIDWKDRTAAQRAAWWADDFGRDNSQTETTLRKEVCARDIWAELMHGDVRTLDNRTAKRINNVLLCTSGWKATNGIYTIYGRQRGFIRVTEQ